MLKGVKEQLLVEAITKLFTEHPVNNYYLRLFKNEIKLPLDRNAKYQARYEHPKNASPHLTETNEIVITYHKSHKMTYKEKITKQFTFCWDVRDQWIMRYG